MAKPRKCTTEFVQNDKARLGAFKRRSNCLLKKASELSTLCDVDVAVLIYADHLPDRPLVYPPESGESLRIFKKLKENPRCVNAAKSKPDKFLDQVNQFEGPNDMFCDDITSLNAEELNSLLRVLDAKEAEVAKKIEAMERRKNETAVVDDVSETNNGFFLFDGIDHHSMLFHHQSHGFPWPVSFSVVDNEASDKQMFENNNGFLNQNSGHVNNNYNGEITTLNIEEWAVDETSDPNCLIFTGDDRQSDPQLDGLQLPISFSVMGEEDDASKSKSEHSTKQNSSLWNPISGHSNINHFDEPMSFDLSESDIAEIMEELYDDEIEPAGEKSSNHMLNCWNCPESFSDEFSYPNSVVLNGVSQNPPSSSYSSVEMPIPCLYKVGDDTPISEPDHLTDINSWLLDEVAEPEEAKDESNTMDEKTMETMDCENFSENGDGESLDAIFHDQVPDTNCLFFNSENPMYDGYGSLDYQPLGFQLAIPYP